MNYFEEIPQEINVRISSFLSISDALKLQSSCKYLKSCICLNFLRNASPIVIHDLHKDGDRTTGDEIMKYTSFTDIFFPTLIHTVKLSCTGVDQGWGNRKGKIYISEIPNGATTSQKNDIGRIIATSPTFTHSMKKYELFFKPKPGFSYALCYKVGGGGGHSIFVQEVMLRSYIHLAAAPLANKLFDTLPDLFLLVLVRSVLTTFSKLTENNYDNCAELLLSFQSLGLDLRKEQHVEHSQIVLKEFMSKLTAFEGRRNTRNIDTNSTRNLFF